MASSGRGDEKKGRRRGGDSGGSDEERDALRRAFADVKPLGGRSKKRVMPPSAIPEPRVPRGPSGSRSAHEPLFVEREANGIVLGKRSSTHPSIVDRLEDPKLEIDGECDLHGQTSAEAERTALRFLRESQQDGKRWVLLIVGKGLHSPGGKGTLRTNMVDALSTRGPSRFVLAFRTAPRHLGGGGALVVRLVDRL